MIFLGTISNICGKVLRGGSLEVCNSMYYLCFLGVFSIAVLVLLEYSSKFIALGCRASRPCDSLLWSPWGVNYWAILTGAFQRYAQCLI